GGGWGCGGGSTVAVEMRSARAMSLIPTGCAGAAGLRGSEDMRSAILPKFTRRGAARYLTVNVRTATECAGSSSEKPSEAVIESRTILTASAVANPLTAASESATTRSTTAVEDRAAPRTLTRAVAGRSRSVLTALR